MGATLLCLALAAEPEAAQIDKRVTEALRAFHVPGAAVVVVRGHHTLVAGGYGVREQGKPQPVTAHTVFPLASCSKAFTTTLLARLVDDGVLGWDDPVRKHLPGFHLADPHADALVTLRDLLTHRTGLGGHDLLWYRAAWPLDETLRRVTRLPLEYPFRAGYRYSSIMYLAAGRALEQAADAKWDQLVRKRLCEPLGLTGVTFTTREIPPTAERASGHRLERDGKLTVVPWYEITEPNPSGSVNATATDLAAWLKFHLSGGLGPTGQRIVSATNLAETHTPQTIIRLEGLTRALNPDTVQLSYGMGWLIADYRGKKVLTHGGMIDGFRVQVTLLPEEDVGIAVLANLHDTRMTAALTNSLIDWHCGLPAKDWNGYFRKLAAAEAAERAAALQARALARKPDTRPSLPLAAFAGEYTHPAYGTATVSEADGRLTLKWSSFTCRLDHFEADTFRILDGQFEEQLAVFGILAGQAATLRFLEVEFKRK
jgi:CubicO group peptidase (beta-lactamase class C family)